MRIASFNKASCSRVAPDQPIEAARSVRLSRSSHCWSFMLLLVCVLFTVQAGPLKRYLDRTAASLHDPQHYIEQVLTRPAVPNPGDLP